MKRYFGKCWSVAAKNMRWAASIAEAAMGTCERQSTVGTPPRKGSRSCWSPTWIPRFAPRALIENWLSVPKHNNLLFRVAVREIEAWLLADSKGLAGYLAVKPGLVPKNPEALPDPKRNLVELARKSRRKQIREDIVPRIGSTAQIGPGYNACLSEFVQSVWDVESAANRAASLRRTLDRLSTFRPAWPPAR